MAFIALYSYRARSWKKTFEQQITSWKQHLKQTAYLLFTHICGPVPCLQSSVNGIIVKTLFKISTLYVRLTKTKTKTKIPSEMDVAKRYKLLILLTQLTWFTLLTRYTLLTWHRQCPRIFTITGLRCWHGTDSVPAILQLWVYPVDMFHTVNLF